MSRVFQTYKSNDEPVPGYRLVRFLGKGNFGEVWMASAPGNKKVALKIIDLRGREGLQESKAIERIKDINHAHLVSLFAYWLIDGEGRILDHSISQLSLGSSVVQESAPAVGGTMFVDTAKPARPVELIVAMSLGSKNLADLLEEHRKQQQVGIPVDTLLEYVEEAAKGLDYLNSPIHDLGRGPLPIIHGDVKPQNLLIVGNSLQICDFGLARSIDELRKTATAMGSFAYAAPELLEGHPHVRSDQYCLAVSYIELRTGELPLFGQTNILKIAELHREGKLDLSGLGPVEAEVIRKAIRPDPLQRWPSCREMVRRLRAAVEQDAAGKTPTKPSERIDATNTRTHAATETTPAKKRAARRPRRLVLVATLVLMIAGMMAAAVAWDRWLKPAANQERQPGVVTHVEPPKPAVERTAPSPAAGDSTQKTTVVDNAQKPPLVNLVEKPVFADLDLWRQRLQDTVSWTVRRVTPFAAEYLKHPPQTIVPARPLIEPLVAGIRSLLTDLGHQRGLILIRGRLAELEGSYDAALKIYSDGLPQDLAAARAADTGLLLARAACHLTIAAKGTTKVKGSTFVSVPWPGWTSNSVAIVEHPSQQEISEAQDAAQDAVAAQRVADCLEGQIGALELSLAAHTFLYFADATALARNAMYARGLDDLTALRKLAPRSPQEFRWCAAWAQVCWDRVRHGPNERSELLKNYGNAVFFAAEAVRLCSQDSLRIELTASLLKPYIEAALHFADEQLGKRPPPNPPFRTDLEKKQQEWRQIAVKL